ncbi:MAG: copper resistance protein CopC [Pontimonas sp.]
MRKHKSRAAGNTGASSFFAAVMVSALSVALVASEKATSYAHNQVVQTTPAADETVTDNPVSFEIVTSGDLLVLGGNSAGFAIIVNDRAGLFYGDGCVTVDGIALSTSANLGDSGDYTVTYQYISGDGHTLSGKYNFAFERPEDYLPAAGQAQAPICGEAPIFPLESTTSDEDSSQDPAAGQQDAPGMTPISPPTAESAAFGDNRWWAHTATVVSVIVPLGVGAALVYWFVRRKNRRASGA